MGVTKTLPQDAAFLVFDPLTRRLRFLCNLAPAPSLRGLQDAGHEGVSAGCRGLSLRSLKDVLASEGKERLPSPKPFLLRKLIKALPLFLLPSFFVGFFGGNVL
ncbi:hypothetical protein SAMN05443252_103162 [Bacillus sp. OV322]|uniref:hypothetical protein n=1 Tax=Bacillus sp. OV322 TaxID=1882764 RepID=UPI0008E2C995|nr:hypothetical protein [Bacillus sp. OV322]SFC38508.1 hypothetical protein SAMN05443252_103162 [Bacillus sp. OV322]